MAQDRDHDKKREEREEREKREHEHRERDDAKRGGRERVVAEDPETQRRDQQRQQTQSDPQSEVADDFQPGPHIEGTVLREGPEGPRPGTPRQAPAAGDILMGSPGVDEAEMTRIQMEPHPEASPEMIAAYLTEAFGSDDPALMARAIGAVARSQGMAAVAGKAGLSRENLYRALGGDASPEFGTVIKVLHALGIDLIAQPRTEEAAQVL